jgi:nucleoside-triphosphatase THEP1
MIIVTGERHAGKTGLILRLVEQARDRSLKVAGIACPGLWAKGQRAGFDLLGGQLGTGQ